MQEWGFVLLGGRSRGSYRDLLNANEFKEGSAAIFFQAELDRFSYAFHQRVQILSLSVTASESRNRGYVVSVLIAFDQNSKFTRRFHRLILTWEEVGHASHKGDGSV
jgi:hypothetical protein